jgi:CO/xanthine dehydrogenase FAD-binding subunit
MLMLPRFDYYEAGDLEEACSLLRQMGDGARIIAGGTDLLVNMKRGRLSPKYLVSVAKIPGLSEIRPHEGGLAIGSHVTASQLAESRPVRKQWPLLLKGASLLGSPLIRNRATIGGNIVTARPAADLPPPLLAMRAAVKLDSGRSRRSMPLDDFFVGPGETMIEPDEILTEITLHDPAPFTGGDYRKLMQRNALEIAIVGVAVSITLDKPDGIIKDATVILSSVAPKAIHALSAEELLVGEKPAVKLLDRAAVLASGDCTPITDIRAGAEYRCAMVEALTRDALKTALKEARSNGG